MGAELVYLYLPEHAWTVDRVLDAAVTSLERYSTWYGPYAYPRLTLIAPPTAGQGAGGMEYPSLVTLGTPRFQRIGRNQFADRLGAYFGDGPVHEIAHQWWHSWWRRTRQRNPGWMRVSDYSAVRLMQSGWGEERDLVGLGGSSSATWIYRRGRICPLSPPSPWQAKPGFQTIEYGVAVYSKPAMALLTLQNILGEEKMDTLMKAYFLRWQFGHPTAQDFQAVAVETTGDPLDWFFGAPEAETGLVYGNETLNYSAKEIGADWLTVEREGGPAIPVEIEVTFAGGERERVIWAGAEPVQTFRFDRPVRSFEINPNHKVAVELAWADNGLSQTPDWQAWLAAAGRLIFHLQDWLLILGGI